MPDDYYGYRYGLLCVLTTATRPDPTTLPQERQLRVSRKRLWNRNTMKWTQLTKSGFNVGEGEEDVKSRMPGSPYSNISCSNATRAANSVRHLLEREEFSRMRTIPVELCKNLVDFDAPDLKPLAKWMEGLWRKPNQRDRQFPAGSGPLRERIFKAIDESGTVDEDGDLVSRSDSFKACAVRLAEEFLGDDGFVLQDGVDIIDPALVPTFESLHTVVWSCERKSKEGFRWKGQNITRVCDWRLRLKHQDARPGPDTQLTERRGKKRGRDGREFRPATPHPSSRAATGRLNEPYTVSSDEEDIKMEEVDRKPGPSIGQLRVDRKDRANGAASAATGSGPSTNSQPTPGPLPNVLGGGDCNQLLATVKGLKPRELDRLIKAAQLEKRHQQDWDNFQNELGE